MWAEERLPKSGVPGWFPGHAVGAVERDHAVDDPAVQVGVRGMPAH